MPPTGRQSIRQPPRKHLDHKLLFQDAKVREWFDEMGLRSALSAQNQLRHLGLLAYRVDKDPRALVELARDEPAELRSILLEYAKRTAAEGRLASYVAKVLDGLRAWLVFNGVEFRQFPRLAVERGQSLVDEKVPTREEFREILSLLAPRGRLAWLLMGHSGIRPGAVVTLRLKDVPELKLEPAPGFDLPPGAESFRVFVSAHSSKNRTGYTTLAPIRSTGEALIAYIKERAAEGEEISGDSPVIAVKPMGTRTGTRQRGDVISTTKLAKELRQAIKKAKTEPGRMRPYTARSFFFAALTEGRVDRDVREALGGHVSKNVTVSNYTYGSRRQMRPGDIAVLRSEYEKALPALGVERDPENLIGQMRTTLLTIAGMPERDAARHAGTDNEEVARMVRELLGARDDKTKTAAPSNGDGRRQVVVHSIEAEQMITAGTHEFFANLGIDRVVLKTL
jgi:integrase